jgi:chorismate synthase
MGSTFGRLFRVTTWGESHGPALGVVVDGCPAGLELNEEIIQRDLDRRRVGQSEVTSPRQERDRVTILSGVFEGKTTGAPISLITYNADADSSKYEPLRDVFRPGHADYTYWVKYGHRDHRGGGRSSARETWGRVAAGAIARQLLRTVAGVEVYGFVRIRSQRKRWWQPSSKRRSRKRASEESSRSGHATCRPDSVSRRWTSSMP